MSVANRPAEEKPTHSPGPWSEGESHESMVQIIKIGSDGKFVKKIATVHGMFGDPSMGADARLIVAAPDMYEALKGLYADLMDYIRLNHLGGENNHWMVAARAALLKAEGNGNG